MGDSERRPMPALLIVILALFGLVSIRNLTGSVPRPESSPGGQGSEKAATAAPPPGRRDEGPGDRPEARILRPLLDYYRTGADGEDARDAAFARSRNDRLYFLIAMVPDPVRGTSSNRFDETIGTIQRACESEGFVLDGFRIPWGPAATAEPGAKADAGTPDREVDFSVRMAGRTAKGRIEPHRESTTDPDRDPGLLLFRGERPADSTIPPAAWIGAGVVALVLPSDRPAVPPAALIGAGAVALALPYRPTPMLAVLLVPETPTLGLDKVAMARSLDLAATWDVRNRPPAGHRVFPILGPCFSGSQTSMEQALAGWTRRTGAPGVAAATVPGPANTFKIISGSASAIRSRDLRACVGRPHSVEFRATVHQSRSLVRTLLGHLGVPLARVAMLVEANTQFGGSTRPGTRRADEVPVYYPFPLHISKVRGSYQKRGYLSDQSSGALRSFERLTIPFEDTGGATDIPAMQTPRFTTAVDELVLGQILADISRREIRAVGIVATDPLDTIFLARQVRQFLPNVRLFTTEPDLLYTHPQNADDLRGTLVASTYPLYPSNQSWSYSYQGDVTHVFFSSESIQGTYNAAIAHLETLGDPDIPARFLEYGVPFDPPGSYAADGWSVKPRKPPIWIGEVGNHGLYPVAVALQPDLQWTSWASGSGVPASGKDLVIVGLDDGLLHIRAFDAAGDRTDTFETKDSGGALDLKTVDASGEVLSDKPESILPAAQSAAIAALKQRLPGLSAQSISSPVQTEQVLSEVTSIIDPNLDPGYLYVHEQSESEYAAMLGMPTPPHPEDQEVAWRQGQADAWGRIRDWFKPEYPSLWRYLFAGATAVALAGAGLGLLVYRWAAAGDAARFGEGFQLGPLPMEGLAQFLNCRRAADAARPGGCHGPGPYLPIGLFVILLVYFAIGAPYLAVIRWVPWFPAGPLEGAPFWMGSLAYAVLLSLAIALIMSVVAGWTTRRRGRAVRPGLWRILPGLWGLLALCILLFLFFALPPIVGDPAAARRDRLAYSFPELPPDGVGALIRLARSMAIPSGVSPVLSLLFLGVAGLTWVYAQLRRRFLLEQYTPDVPERTRPPGAIMLFLGAARLAWGHGRLWLQLLLEGNTAEAPAPALRAGVVRRSGDEGTMQSIREECGRIHRMLDHPVWPFRDSRIRPWIAAGAFIGLLYWPVIEPVRAGSWPAWWDSATLSEAIAGLLIVVIFGLLGWHTIQLVVLWRRVRQVMNLVLRLPLGSALDRIPSRVAAWLKQPPRPGDGRFDLIRRQARALAERGKDDREALEYEDADLGALLVEPTFSAGLEHLELDKVPRVLQGIRDYLLKYWESLKVQDAFPDAAEGKPEAKKGGEDRIGDGLHTIAAAVSGQDVDRPRPPKRRPEWVRHAEDLLAMFFLRWLAAALAQVWTLIGSLVVGSVALLFAISSYPYPFQDRLMLGMGLLIAVLVLMILAIVVGFNRDEMVSRLSNTTPNSLKSYQQLLGGLATYIIPLLGALTAMISSDASDTLRSLIDPILRQFR